MAAKTRKVAPDDLLDISQLGLLSNDSVLVGGTAITMMLGADKTSHYKYPHSTDIDAVSKGTELIRLERSLGRSIVENLTDHRLVRLGCGIGGDSSVVEDKSPFMVVRFPNSRLDIFTAATGLGPINVDSGVFKNAVRYTFANREFNVAHPSYIMATTINPLVATDNRILRSFLVMSDFAIKNGNEAFFRDVMVPAVSYIMDGSENLKEEIERIKGNRRYSHIFRDNKKHYLDYKKYFAVSLPNRLETEKKKIVSFAVDIGIGTRQQNSQLVEELADFIRKSA